METTRHTENFVTVKLTENEANQVADALFEALFTLSQLSDDKPYNWKADPTVLKDLHNEVKPLGHGRIV